MRKILAPYFSTKGRSSRREWWIVEILALIGLKLNQSHFVATLTDAGFNPGAAVGQTSVLLTVILLWVMHASNVRRLHDRGKSGWWALAFLIPGIGQLWCIVECGFMKGQPHANRYGPPAGERTIYQTLAGQMTARLQALTAAAAAPGHAPKTVKTSIPAAPRAEPAAAAPKPTRRVSVLASSQRPTVQRPAVQRSAQRGGTALSLPSGSMLRMAIAIAALLLGLAAMALTTGIPIPTGVAPVGVNPDTGVFRLGGQPAQP